MTRRNTERERAVAALAGSSFLPGQRVELHPGADRWMMGDRYGAVVRAKNGIVDVKLDRSGRTLQFSEGDLLRPRIREP